MLYELFSWLNSDDSPFPSNHQVVTRVDYEHEHKQALMRGRELHANIHDARCRKSSLTIVNAALQCLLHHSVYMHFMIFCQTQLKEHDGISLTLLALKYALLESVDNENPALAVTKINQLFLQLLQENKEVALAFYHEHQPVCDTFQQMKLVVAVELTKDHLARLISQLMCQENPLTMIPLFEQFIDDTELFSAAILWFLQRGVSIESILETGLLQQFMLYNLVELHASTSPTQYLYQLLGQFPESATLLKTAGEVECEDRAINAFAITGVRCEQSHLRQVQIKKPPLEFTPSKENFFALYQLFGSNFLGAAIAWQAENGNEVWTTALRGFLNRESCINEELPVLIIFAAIKCGPRTLEALATLLSDETVEKLVGQRCGAVLHLLPYKTALPTRISEGDITQFLKEMVAEDASVFDVIPQLRSLLGSFNRVNKTVAVLVYEAIFDHAIQHSYLLEDTGLIKQLRKFSEMDAVVAKKGNYLQAQFDDCIETQALAGILNTESYHLIEDTWLDVSRKLVRLKEIARLTTHFPGDKYKMQAHLAKIYFLKYPSYFSLDDFFLALGVTATVSAEGVSEYERLLIEILTTIDDETIRNSIVEKLYTKGRSWIHEEYGGGCVFDRAVQQGNVGLIKWLKLDKHLDRHTINLAVFTAAEAGQWHLVDYLCRSSNHKHKSQQKIFKELLPLAAGAGQLDLVKFLCETAIKPLQDKPVEQAFVKAAINGHLSVVEYCHGLNIGVPRARLMATTLTLVIHHEHPSMIEYLGNFPENPSLSRAVRDALLHESEHERMHVIKQLCDLRMNAPSQDAIGDAFIRSIRCGQLQVALYFLNLPTNAPNQKAVDIALVRAVMSGHMNSVVFMFNLTTHYPSPEAIEKALQKAGKLKRADFIDYLSSLTMTPPSARATEKQFQSAAQQGDLAAIMKCCHLNQPNLQSIHSALKKASSSEHQEATHYLCGLLSYTSRRHVVPPCHERLDGVKKSVSCHSLNTLGLFASPSSSPQRRASSSDYVEPMSP